MTPPPVTTAGQDASSGSHRRTVRKRTAPSAPRRLSGPARQAARAPAAPSARGRAATAEAAAAGATVRVPRPAPSRPRQPAQAPRIGRRRRAAAASRPAAPLPARAAAFIRSLPDHRLLDRLLRGRAWIPLLGVMLAGIVAMQVEVLKLGANVGQSLQLSTTLQSRNQLLRANVAALADDQRIERIAARMGMVMPPPTAAVFLSPRAGTEVRRALSDIHQPDPTTFLASLPAAGPTSPQGTSAGATSTTPPTATGGTTLTTPAGTTATPTGGATATATTIAAATTATSSAGATTPGATSAGGVPASTPTTAGGVETGGAGVSTGGTGSTSTASGASAGAGAVALTPSTQTTSSGG